MLHFTVESAQYNNELVQFQTTFENYKVNRYKYEPEKQKELDEYFQSNKEYFKSEKPLISQPYKSAIEHQAKIASKPVTSPKTDYETTSPSSISTGSLNSNQPAIIIPQGERSLNLPKRKPKQNNASKKPVEQPVIEVSTNKTFANNQPIVGREIIIKNGGLSFAERTKMVKVDPRFAKHDTKFPRNNANSASTREVSRISSPISSSGALSSSKNSSKTDLLTNRSSFNSPITSRSGSSIDLNNQSPKAKQPDKKTAKVTGCLPGLFSGFRRR